MLTSSADTVPMLCPTISDTSARDPYWKTGIGPSRDPVQGAGVIGEGWRPQIDALKDRYTVLWIDNRGIGQSVDHVGRTAGRGHGG